MNHPPHALHKGHLMHIGRRGFIKRFTASAASAAVGAALFGADEHASGAGEVAAAAPEFHGPHQAGIFTPAPAPAPGQRSSVRRRT